MLVMCLLAWLLVSVALGPLLGRCIAVGQARDAQRQGALWCEVAPRRAVVAAAPRADDLAVPVIPAPRQPMVPVGERV